MKGESMMFEAAAEGQQGSTRFSIFRQVMALFRIVAPVVEFLTQFLVPNVVELRTNQGAHGAQIVRRLRVPWKLRQIALRERPLRIPRCLPKPGQRGNWESRLGMTISQLH